MRYLSPAAFALALAVLSSNAVEGQGLQFVSVTPCRIVDTRNPNGTFGGPEMTANSSRDFPVPASACNIPSGAAAYSLNVTVVPNAQLGYLTIWPTGQGQPFVSTLNSDGRIKANAAIVPAGNNGSVSVFVTDNTQVIIDIDGYFVPDGTNSSSLQFYPVAPCRVADTRPSQGFSGALGPPFLSGGAPGRSFPVLSTCNLPQNALAYSLNFTAVPHGSLLYITVWPTGQSQPVVSTLNAPTGAVTANAAIVPAGSGGQISVFASDDTDLVIDVDGYFAAPSSGGLDLFSVVPCRVRDTRNEGPPFSGTIVTNISGNGCMPANSGAEGFVLNATVVPPGSLQYLTLWPDGQAQPYVSTLNAYDGAITSNMAIVPTGNGSIDAFASNPTQLILDISGYFAPPGGGVIGPGCSGPPCAFISGAAIGQNLQTLVTVTLSPPASSDTQVTISSSNPSAVLISPFVGQAGSASASIPITAGTTTFAVYAQALVGSGSATISASANGYGTGTGTVMLFPSAFVLASPGGVGVAFTAGEFGSTPLNVYAERLDGSGNPAQVQQVRGGENATVNVTVADPSLGSVSPSSLGFNGGVDTQTTTFTAGGNQGQTTITANEPPGFSSPAGAANQLTVTVGAPQLSCTSNVVVGQNLAAQGQCSIQGAAPSDTTITLTSNSPGTLLLAPNLSSGGSGSITIVIRQGTSSSAPFYLYGVANSGTATYSAASSLGNATSTISLLRSGFVIDGGSGIGQAINDTFPGPDLTVTVEATALDASGNPYGPISPLAGGLTASVNVTSSNTSVATIVGAPAVIAGGTSSAIVTFHPTGNGSTTITAATPSGFTTPAAGGAIGATVGQPKIIINSVGNPVGNNLQEADTVIVTAPPSSNLTVTLSSPGPVKFSATGTDAGSNPLNITVPAGQQSMLFYIYGGNAPGTTVTINGSAPGFLGGSGTVSLGLSGIVISGGGSTPFFNTPLSAGSQPLSIEPAVLDSGGNFIANEALAGSVGALSVSLNNSSASVGTVPSSVTIPVGGASGTATFSPKATGTDVVTIVTPSGFSAANNNSSTLGPELTITVQ